MLRCRLCICKSVIIFLFLVLGYKLVIFCFVVLSKLDFMKDFLFVKSGSRFLFELCDL